MQNRVRGTEKYVNVMCKEGWGESVSVGVTGLFDEAYCRWEETVLMDRNLLPEGSVSQGLCPG